MPALRPLGRLIAAFGVASGDSVELRQRKALLVTVALLVLPASAIWGALYWLVDERPAALLAWAYSGLSILSLAWFRARRGYQPLRLAQLLLILLVPFSVGVALGGLTASGAVVLWSLLAPLGVIAVDGPGQAWRWFAGFAAAIAVTTPLSAVVRPMPAELPDGLLLAFLTMNLAAVSLIAFILLVSFARQREQAQRRADGLLMNVLPREIAELLKTAPGQIAQDVEAASILFADVVDFTPMSARLSASQVVSFLDELFSAFDELVERAGLEKIKTIGDCYMVAAGVPDARPDHAHAIARLALQMQRLVADRSVAAGPAVQLRIGINSGPVVAGVIGRRKFIYDLWGDAVNTASRMESHGTAGRIQVAEPAWALIRDAFSGEPRGEIEVKGKGRMRTWYLLGERTGQDPDVGEEAGRHGRNDPLTRQPAGAIERRSEEHVAR